VSDSYKTLKSRSVFLLLGLAAIALGVVPVLRGDLFYENWWGGLVFSPIAIILGLVMILGAVFKPNIFK